MFMPKEEEQKTLQALVNAINYASKTGETSFIFQSPLTENIIEYLEDNKYIVKPYGTNQHIISFKEGSDMYDVESCAICLFVSDLEYLHYGADIGIWYSLVFRAYSNVSKIIDAGALLTPYENHIDDLIVENYEDDSIWDYGAGDNALVNVDSKIVCVPMSCWLDGTWAEGNDYMEVYFRTFVKYIDKDGVEQVQYGSLSKWHFEYNNIYKTQERRDKISVNKNDTVLQFRNSVEIFDDVRSVALIENNLAVKGWDGYYLNGTFDDYCLQKICELPIIKIGSTEYRKVDLQYAGLRMSNMYGIYYSTEYYGLFVLANQYGESDYSDYKVFDIPYMASFLWSKSIDRKMTRKNMYSLNMEYVYGDSRDEWYPSLNISADPNIYFTTLIEGLNYKYNLNYPQYIEQGWMDGSLLFDERQHMGEVSPFDGRPYNEERFYIYDLLHDYFTTIHNTNKKVYVTNIEDFSDIEGYIKNREFWEYYDTDLDDTVDIVLDTNTDHSNQNIPYNIGIGMDIKATFSIEGYVYYNYNYTTNGKYISTTTNPEADGFIAIFSDITTNVSILPKDFEKKFRITITSKSNPSDTHYYETTLLNIIGLKCNDDTLTQEQKLPYLTAMRMYVHFKKYFNI